MREGREGRKGGWVGGERNKKIIHPWGQKGEDTLPKKTREGGGIVRGRGSLGRME